MNLKPVSEYPELMNAIKSGKAVQVIMDCSDFEKNHRDNYHNMLGFVEKDKYKFCTIMQEIANMPHHYVVAGKNGKLVCGLHDDIFYIDDDEYQESIFDDMDGDDEN